MYVAVLGEDSDILGPSDMEESVAAAKLRRQKRTSKHHDISDSEGAEEERSRKKSSSALIVMTDDQERELVDFFAAHPEYYDQSLQSFKQRTRKEALLDELGKTLGVSGECLSILISLLCHFQVVSC